MSGYTLEKKQKEEVMCIVKEFLIRTTKIDEDSDWVEETIELDLTKLKIRVSPAQLNNVLKCLGYKLDNFDSNGWEMDFMGYYELETPNMLDGLPSRIIMYGGGWDGWLQIRNEKFDF